MGMNVPLVVGGAAAAVGIAAGVVAERISHGNLEQRKAGMDAQRNAGQQWISDANEHFGTEIETDRLRTRDLDGKLEDYTLEHPRPDGVTYGRNQSWRSDVYAPDASREGFWGLTLGAAGAGGAVVGGFTWGIAAEGARTAGTAAATAIGVGLLAGGLGVAAGSAVSSWLPH